MVSQYWYVKKVSTFYNDIFTNRRRCHQNDVTVLVCSRKSALFMTMYLQKDGADVIILLFKEMKALLESNVRYSRYNCAVYNREKIAALLLIAIHSKHYVTMIESRRRRCCHS